MNKVEYLFANDVASLRVHVEVYSDSGPVPASLDRAIVDGITRSNDVVQITDSSPMFRRTPYWFIIFATFGGLIGMFASVCTLIVWFLWPALQAQPVLSKDLLQHLLITACVTIPVMTVAVAGSLCMAENAKRTTASRQRAARAATGQLLHTHT